MNMPCEEWDAPSHFRLGREGLTVYLRSKTRNDSTTFYTFKYLQIHRKLVQRSRGSLVGMCRLL